MRTNCKEVSEPNDNTWSATEYVTFDIAKKLIEEGNQNVVASFLDDDTEYISVPTIGDLFISDAEGMEFSVVRYYERQN